MDARAFSHAQPPRRPEAGLFVAFEGVDGAGKSAQLAAAVERLRARGETVVATREPGGSTGGEAIRALLVSGDTGRWSPMTELLLFTAARRDHLERVVLPALSRDEVVLTDRFVDSTRAYQAAGRGLDAGVVEALHAVAIGLEPDLTLIFDVSAETARARGRPGAEDRFERFGAGFHERLRGAYRALAKETPARRLLIDAERSFDEVAAEVAENLLTARSLRRAAGDG